MIRYQSSKQLTLSQFGWPFQSALDENNRWVKLAQCIPWDELAQGYYEGLSHRRGRPSKDARLVIGAVIIKHKLCLSDRETVAQLQENPYLQYFVGLSSYQMQAPFAPSLFVEIRKRMGQSVFDMFQSAIIDAVEGAKASRSSANRDATTDDDDKPPPDSAAGGGGDDDDEQLVAPSAEPTHQGQLIIDATVAPQAIRYPTDLSLLNEAREFTEQIIDELYPHTPLQVKPRTYRQRARKDYLAVAKQKRPSKRVRRRGVKQQLQYLRRNLGHIEELLAYWPE